MKVGSLTLLDVNGCDCRQIGYIYGDDKDLQVPCQADKVGS